MTAVKKQEAKEQPADKLIDTKSDEKPSKVAKAGKRSARSIAETEAAEAKQARKVATNQLEVKNTPKKPPRTKLERSGKKYQDAAKKIDSAKTYELSEAIALAIETNPANFDASLELHINLNVDPKQADQNIRSTVVLPSGTGKEVRIAVLADDESSAKAKKAGADLTDAELILQQIEKEEINFETLIASPALMPKLGKYAKILGPKGLMPNPKSGTVTNDVVSAVKDAKSGKIEFRVDSYGIIHLSFGKTSFGPEKLTANADAVISQLKAVRPSSVKGSFIKSAVISSTMGPAIKAQV